MVPHGITGNPRIAATYARLVVEFLRSVPAGAAAADEPHIVEFGGGSGRFAFLLVRALRELVPEYCGSPTWSPTSRPSACRLAAILLHQPLVDQGLIDFAVLDADGPGPLELVASGWTLDVGTLDSPVVGIANYVFDTLRQPERPRCAAASCANAWSLPRQPGHT